MGKGKGERAERKEKEWLLGKQLKWKECSMGWKETDNDRMMKKYREKRMDRKGVERARREPEKMWRQMGSIKKERRRSKKSGRDRLKCQKAEGTSRKPKNPNLSANMRKKRFGWAEWRSKHEGKNTSAVLFTVTIYGAWSFGTIMDTLWKKMLLIWQNWVIWEQLFFFNLFIVSKFQSLKSDVFK